MKVILRGAPDRSQWKCIRAQLERGAILEMYWPVEGIWWNGVILRKYEDEVYEIKFEGDYQGTGKNCYHPPHFHVRNIRRPSTPVKNFLGRAIYDAELNGDEHVVCYVSGRRERETGFAGLCG